MTEQGTMKPALILLTILVVGGAIVWLIDKLFYHKQAAENVDEAEQNATDSSPSQGCADESCGIRSICPSEQILKGECQQEITYYEDEELDAFIGRDENDYSADEEEQSRCALHLAASRFTGLGTEHQASRPGDAGCHPAGIHATCR